MPGPVPITGTSNQLKKSIGRLVIKINSEILDFVHEKRKIKPDVPLSAKGNKLKETIKEKKEALEEALKDLEGKPDYIIQERMEKTVKIVKENIATANKALNVESSEVEIEEHDLAIANNAASEVIEEVENMENLAQRDMSRLTATLSSLATPHDVVDDSVIDDSEVAWIQRELRAIEPYQAERFERMKKEITEKMTFHKLNLLSKWKQQKDILDYLALKEIRSEFEATHKQARYAVSEWERRKYSERLSDLLMDLIDEKFNKYIFEFRRMDEEKRRRRF